MKNNHLLNLKENFIKIFFVMMAIFGVFCFFTLLSTGDVYNLQGDSIIGSDIISLDNQIHFSNYFSKIQYFLSGLFIEILISSFLILFFSIIFELEFFLIVSCLSIFIIIVVQVLS